MSRCLDFLLVGAPRSGTTSLFRHLRRHPALFIPAAKEIPYFTDASRLEQGWDAFMATFFAGAGPDQMLGKLTPHYWDRPEVPALIHRQLPDVRLMALLRNPVDRAFSHYRFLVRRGVEPRSFADAVLDPTWTKFRHYVPPGEYGRIVHNYLREFDRDRFLVLFTDQLRREPESVLQMVQAHLDLDQPFPTTGLDRRYNVGSSTTRLPWLVPLVRRTPLRRLWRALPERVREAAGKWYFFEFAPRSEAAPELPAETRRRLVEHYRPDVAHLEELIGRPVPWEEFQSASTT